MLHLFHFKFFLNYKVLYSFLHLIYLKNLVSFGAIFSSIMVSKFLKKHNGEAEKRIAASTSRKSCTA